MGGHQGVPEPYVILKEFVCEAVYDPPEERESPQAQNPEDSPPKDVRQDGKPGPS